VQIVLKRAVVRPGETQAVSLHGIGNTPFQLLVTMPDGETLAPPPGSASLSGTWTFVQPPNTLTHAGRRATVTVTVGGQTIRAHYTVGFAPIDLVAPHGLIPDGSDVTVWVHTQPRTRVRLQSSPDGEPFTLVTGPHGWTQRAFRFSNLRIAPPYDPAPVALVASATVHGRHDSTRTDFMVRAFQFGASVQNIQIVHQVGTNWVPTSSVRMGEQIEIRGEPFITEPAGTTSLCVGATVSLVQSYRILQMAPMQCTNPAQPEMIADLTIGSGLVTGSADIDIDASYENGTFHASIPITVTG
jgi:hypothetical protein